MVVFRRIFVLTLLSALLGGLSASTLQQLSVEQMIDQSTQVVRGHVVASRAVSNGALVFTMVEIEVAETWKGPEASHLEVALPGGTYGGQEQSFAGVPTLAPDVDYLLFLWTGSNGITQVIGLAQGVFEVVSNDDGSQLVERPAMVGVAMLDQAGNPVNDQPLSFQLDSLRSRVEAAGTRQ